MKASLIDFKQISKKAVRDLLRKTITERNADRTLGVELMVQVWPVLSDYEFFRYEFRLIKNLKNLDKVKNKVKRKFAQLNSPAALSETESAMAKFCFEVIIQSQVFL